MRRLVLHIDRLVLRGVDRADAAAVSAALQAELQSLLRRGEAGPLLAQRDAALVQVGQARLAQGADAAALGRAVAGRIAGGAHPVPPAHGGRP